MKERTQLIQSVIIFSIFLILFISGIFYAIYLLSGNYPPLISKVYSTGGCDDPIITYYIDENGTPQNRTELYCTVETKPYWIWEYPEGKFISPKNRAHNI